MNICYVIYFDGNRKAGHATHARGMASALLGLGHRLHLIAPSWPEIKNCNAKISRAWQIKKQGFYTFSFSISAFVVLALVLVKNRPDVVYARYFNFLFLLIPLIKIFRVPLIVEHNADVLAENRIYRRRYLSSKFHLFAERLLLKGSNGSIVVTNSILNSWSKQNIKPISSIVIRNGVDTGIYRPQDSLACKQELGLDSKSRYIGFVGSFGVVQGIATLLQAFEILAKKDTTLKILFVGANSNELERMRSEVATKGLNDRVSIIGQVPEEIAAKYISASDVCVAPYTTGVLEDEAQCGLGASMKGDPLKIYSYMACGKPIVATYFREAGFFLQEIGAGLAVEPENPIDIAEKITILLSDSVYSHKMGRQGLAYVDKQGGWESAAKQTVAFIEHILAEK